MRSETTAPPFRRMQLPGTIHHRCQITLVFFHRHLLERRSCLLVEHIDPFREAVRQVRARRPFHIDAWVVLPDHAHCIWTLSPGDSDYSAHWKTIKIAFANSIPKTERLSRYVHAKANAAFGNDDFGNMRFAMSETMRRMSHVARAHQSAQAWAGATGKCMGLLVISSFRDHGDLSR